MSDIIEYNVEALAQEILDWRRRYNEVTEELEKITGKKRFKVSKDSTDDVLNSFILDNRDDEDVSDLMTWRSIEKDKTYKYEKRVIIFSPVYPKDSEMRFRCIDAQFVDICEEATHWAKFIEPIKE